ncbi:hypothetical protein GCK72_011782 [Caenorhabditis remanei]|uniref:F-box domain-containing protein n=1 Tax=Caenorhabditis remanei TaxID=31234 RepID=A0A6A5H9H4_CAERE|nr:hypothetical protein GCK72_011782 [Caenorhabditis remanei]KAF1763516.1 hypothetical protein GCK72_011782 [Caenorhabditis remanei]
MFDYEKYFLQLPEPAIKHVLHFLRLPDLATLKETCPDLADLCDLEIRILDNEFTSRPFFQFERCVLEDGVNDVEIMPERQNASVTYYPGNQSVYLFGGETLGVREDGAPRATFNDLWRLDTGTMKWSRVIITSAPYPSPKCHASFVTWKDQLILCGGRAYHHDGRDTFFSEIHFFDVQTSTWNRGNFSPDLMPIGGHSAVVTENFMIMYGGFFEQPTQEQIETLFVVELREQVFHRVHLQKLPIEEDPDESPSQFPKFQWRKTKLVLIREGLLLLTGELLPGDYGSSALIDFDPVDVTATWQWKRIETIGRWWRPKDWRDPRHPLHGYLRQERELMNAVENCSLPNYDFHQIAEVRNSRMVRLVSLGSVEKTSHMLRTSGRKDYDNLQTHYTEFCRQLNRHLEAEFENRMVLHAMSPDSEQLRKTSAVFEYQNIKCRIDGCFLAKQECSAVFRHGAPSFKVRVRIDEIEKNPKILNSDDFDKWELRQRIETTVNQLHSKFYQSGRMEQLAPRVPTRNSLLKRLSLYVTEIDSNVAIEDFNVLRWKVQPMQYPSPVETRDFSLVGAHHDVIMHAGLVKFNVTMKRMGQSVLMTPVSRIPTSPRNSRKKEKEAIERLLYTSNKQ